VWLSDPTPPPITLESERFLAMKMNYFVLGTNDLEASVHFYNALFETSEVSQTFSTERMTYWQGADFTFAIATPFNTERATNGNGTMVGFRAESVDDVQRLHTKVLELGGSCEGQPDHRGPMYSAYARDLDNNKLAFYIESSPVAQP